MFSLTGTTRKAFLAFFLSHIPITLIMDGQAALPSSLYPMIFQDLAKFYSTTFKDNLMTPPHPLFLQSFVTCEILFQLPFFVIASYVLLNSHKKDIAASGSGWFRTACLIYGTHTATTLVPILSTIVFDESLNVTEKSVLFCFYLPYLIFPVWLVIIAAVSENVFGDGNKSKSS